MSRLLPAASLALLVAYATLFASPYDLRVLTVAGLYTVAALGFQIVFGLAGSLFLGYGALYGIGAYAAAILALKADAGVFVTLPAAMLSSACLALVFSPLLVRLGGHYIALGGLAVAQIVWLLIVNAVPLTGGANGLVGVPWTVPRGLPQAGLVWGIVAVAACGFLWLKASRFGRSLVVMRDTPQAAPVLGLSIHHLRAAAFITGALFAGAAGGLSAHVQSVVSPEVLELPVLVTILTIVVVAGAGHPLATVLSALFLIHLPEWLRGLQGAYLLAYGVLLLATVLILPRGIGGLLKSHSRTSPSPHPEPVEGWTPRLPPETVRIENISRQFGGVRAVDDISLILAPSSITGLVGPNGSGKTTLLNLIGGMERPDNGLIWLGDTRLNHLPVHRRARLGIARTFQAPQLPDLATVQDVIAAGGLAFAVESQVGGMLHAFNLESSAALPCGGLPGGVRRRVELARAMIAAPCLLLLDEPSAGLSMEEQTNLAELLCRIAADGAAILVADHSQPFLDACTDRIIRLDAGRIVS